MINAREKMTEKNWFVMLDPNAMYETSKSLTEFASGDHGFQDAMEQPIHWRRGCTHGKT